MPFGARSVATAALTAVIAATITTVGVSPAFAAPAGCASVESASDTSAIQCIADLRLRAEAAAQTASKADEAYNQARIDAAAAQKQASALHAASEQADAVAAKSRARAAVVTAQLSHGGGAVGQTAEVLLSGEGASNVLYHLSRMNELTADTAQLSRDAARDSRSASALQTQAGLAADRSATSALQAKSAFEDAKKAAQTAITLVQQTEDKRDSVSKGEQSALSAAYIDLPPDATVSARVVAFARAQIGEPYVFGAAGYGSWDCSGLTMVSFETDGIDIGGHGATVQYTTARDRGLLVPYDQAQPGDLVFYGSGGDMAHVAVYSGGGNMIEAPHPGADVREVPVRTDGGLQPLVARFTG